MEEVQTIEKIKAPPKISLDNIPPGDALETDIKSWRKKGFLPEGVTTRGLYRDIGVIAWPAILEMLLTQAVSMADQMMVGQLGTWAITAVGLSTQPKYLLVSAVMAINVGATAMVARFKGAGDRAKANNILRQALFINIIIAVICSSLFFIFARPIVRIMGAQEELVLNEAANYLKIQAAGFMTVGLTATITASLRGIGSSRTAMIYNLSANVVNVFFNWVFIYGNLGAPKLGVSGASLATVIGQAVAMIMAFIVITRKRRYLSLSLKAFRPDPIAIGQITKIGIPVIVERLVLRTGMVAYAILVANLGTVVYATHQICTNVMQLTLVTMEGCQVSATSLVGQSLGKVRSDMAHAYSTRCRRAGMALACLMAILFFFGGKLLISLYLDAEDLYRDEVIMQGVKVLRILALLQPLQSSQYILAGVLRGAGDTKATAVIYLITVMIIRPVFAAIFIYVFEWGLLGAWGAMAVDQIVRTTLVLFRFNSGKWITSIKIKT